MTLLEWINSLKFADTSKKPSAMDIFRFIKDKPEQRAAGKELAAHFAVDVAIINQAIVQFGRDVIKYEKIPGQTRDDGTNRYWNIPFTSVDEENLNDQEGFVWVMRPELSKALDLMDS